MLHKILLASLSVLLAAGRTKPAPPTTPSRPNTLAMVNAAQDLVVQRSLFVVVDNPPAERIEFRALPD